MTAHEKILIADEIRALKKLSILGVNVSVLGVDGLTATADELNILDGATLDTAELNVLHNNTATAAELSKLAGITPGTVLASKALVVDAQKALSELAITGALSIGTAGSFAMGTLSSANDTSGVALSASKSKAHAVHADTGGAALTAGSVRAALSRFLIGTAISSGADISTYGHELLLKIIASCNVGGNQGGALGHLESAGALTLTGSINTVKAAVAAFLDLAASATVAAGTVVSALGVNPANFGTTMNGRSAIIHVTNPMAGTWGSFLDMSTATGLTQDAAAGEVEDKFLKFRLNGVAYTIGMKRAAS